MINVKNGYSDIKDSESAINKVIHQIKQENIKLVLFFASAQYDFYLLSKSMKEAFFSAQVIGCTTSGEISNKGLTDYSIVAVSISAEDFYPYTAVIKDINSIPMLHREEVLNTFLNTGMDIDDLGEKGKGFAISLINGLQTGEEKVLSVINSIFKNNEIQLIGGTAGDDLNFQKTYVSENGQVYDNAAIITFVKTNYKFYLHKENIFRPTSKTLLITKADIRTRTVYEINHMPAVEAYAKALNIPKRDLSKYFITNPLGRKINDKIWIASACQIVEQDAIQFYSQIFPNTIVHILEPENPLEVLKKTTEHVRKNIKKPKVVVAINCILRALQFKQQKIVNEISNELCTLGSVIGFSSYGEQLGKMHLNQTLVLLAIGEE